MQKIYLFVLSLGALGLSIGCSNEGNDCPQSLQADAAFLVTRSYISQADIAFAAKKCNELAEAYKSNDGCISKTIHTLTVKIPLSRTPLFIVRDKIFKLEELKATCAALHNAANLIQE